MLDALKSLFENNVISEEIKESIEMAFESRVNEAREQAAQQLREEFAQKYEHDKNTMVEAVDRMISEQLAAEIVEFADDRKQLAEMKVKYATAMKQNAFVMEKFVTRQLASEVKELHEDQVQMAGKFGTLEKFVVEALAQEITEFYKDKQDLAETQEGKTTICTTCSNDGGINRDSEFTFRDTRIEGRHRSSSPCRFWPQVIRGI